MPSKTSAMIGNSTATKHGKNGSLSAKPGNDTLRNGLGGTVIVHQLAE